MKAIDSLSLLSISYVHSKKWQLPWTENPLHRVYRESGFITILETKYWKRKHHPLPEIQIYAYLEECSDDTAFVSFSTEKLKVKEALELEGFWLGLLVLGARKQTTDGETPGSIPGGTGGKPEARPSPRLLIIKLRP